MVQADRMRKLAIVCGPTATGKTAFSVALAEAIGGEVVSADSVSIYRGLDIGSAKPTAEEMKGIPHHMIDVLSPAETFSVSDYERLSLKAIDEIYARGRFPILCGGTGFYIRSGVYSLSYGGTPEKPVGLVYIGCCVKGKVRVEEFHFTGNRQKNRDYAVVRALTLLREEIICL